MSWSMKVDEAAEVATKSFCQHLQVVQCICNKYKTTYKTNNRGLKLKVSPSPTLSAILHHSTSKLYLKFYTKITKYEEPHFVSNSSAFHGQILVALADWPNIEICCQFYQHFTYNFYAQRS